MSSPAVPQHAHQEMSASLSSCECRKLDSQSPSYIPVASGSAMMHMDSIASCSKHGVMPQSRNQMVIVSTCGSEISSESLASRMICTNFVQEESADEVTTTHVKTTGSDCAANEFDQNARPTVNNSETYCSHLPGVIKSNIADIPPRHSRSGSPVLVTDRPSNSSKGMQNSGISLQSNCSPSLAEGEDCNKEVSNTEIIDFACKVGCPPSGLESGQVWNDGKHPDWVDEMAMDARRNVQLSAAFYSSEAGSKIFQPVSNSQSGHAFIFCPSPSPRSTISPFHRRVGSGVTDGWSDNIDGHLLDIPFLDSNVVARDISTRNTGAFLHSSNGQRRDGSGKLFRTETWLDRSFSKVVEFGDAPERTSNGFVKTNFHLRDGIPVNEFIAGLSSPKASQHIADGGSSRSFSRICSHCGTMKTPLWRSGPSGPKSLCNACGIRLKKAGRRLAMSEGIENSDSSPPTPKPGGRLACKPLKRKLDRGTDSSFDAWTARPRPKAVPNFTSNVHLSRRTKVYPSQFRKSQDRESLHQKAHGVSARRRHSPSVCPRGTSLTSNYELSDAFEPNGAFEARNRAFAAARHEFELLESTNPSRFRRDFAKDEEEAAVLLMALSYGLVNA